MGSMTAVVQTISQATVALTYGSMPTINVANFTTSPALGVVATQYASYLAGHPGSLPVATASLSANIEFLHTSMDQLAKTLQRQEEISAEAFSQGPSVLKFPTDVMAFTLPDRLNIPILDLGYLSPMVTTESAAALEALIAMFAGDDSGILMAAESWTTAGACITAAVDSLQQAAGILTATTEGTAFTAATTAIEATVAQGAVIAANATAMGAAMTELPLIRAAAHTRLLAMEAEAQERQAAARATDMVQPGASGAALAAAEVTTRAEVAAFVTGFLQPALEAARPPVMNLGVEVTGHNGGGTLSTGATGVLPSTQVVTEVSGGVSANGQTLATAQYSQSPQQPAQLSAVAGPAAQASEVTRQATSPAGGSTPAGVQNTPAGQAAQAAPQAGQPAGTGPAGTRASAPGTGVVGPYSGTGSPGPGRSAGGPQGPTTTAGVLQRPGTGAGVGVVAGSPASGTGGIGPVSRSGPRLRGGGAPQPLLPRSLSMGGPGAGAGGSGTLGTGGPGSTGGPLTGRGVAGVPGSVGTGGMTGGGAGGVTGSAVHGGARTGGMTGVGGMGGAGGAGGAAAGGKNGRQSPSPFTATTGKGKSKRDLVKEYFRRQFLGEEPQTVKTVIR